MQGAKTQAALAQFLNDRKLPADAAAKPDFFDALIAAAQDPDGAGFSWCNDTQYTVMAALGIVEMGAIVTRGWYRVAAGQCLRPDLRGEPQRLYSYAEAVDADGRTIKRGDAPLAWGGKVALCTRDGKFELSDHKDCAARGLNSRRLCRHRLSAASPSATVRFKEPPDRATQRPAPPPRGFGNVETWVFDLDNTLYPHHLNLWQQVDERIRAYVSDFLKVSKDEAFRVQKDYYKRYGTTMRGLMAEHGMKPGRLSRIRAPDRPLAADAEPGARRGAREAAGPQAHPHQRHAQARRRGDEAARRSTSISRTCSTSPPPISSPSRCRRVYERFLARHGVDPAKAAMFEDLARNLEAPHALGMTTVLVVPEGQREVFREDWELEGRDAAACRSRHRRSRRIYR